MSMLERAASALARRTPRGGGDSHTHPSLRLLLTPRAQASANRLRRLTLPQRGRLLLFSALAAAVWIALFAFTYRVLARFFALPEIGTFLAAQLLSMVLLTSLSMLVFSNLIGALSSLFLAPELERLAAAPLPRRRLMQARMTETMLDASWMVLLFAIPLLLAYGVAAGAAPLFYLLLLLVLPPFLVIPACVGIVFTGTLVRIFPARRTRDVLAVLTVAGGAILYVALRLFQPERFLNPEGFGSFVEFVRGLRTPVDAYLPSQWAVQVLNMQADGKTQLFHLGMLWSTAAAFWVLCEAAMTSLFARGFSKAIEGRGGGGIRLGIIDASVRFLPLAPTTRILIGKDVKNFLRDTTQWSQLLLLAALVIVYVYNFSIVPTVASPVLTYYLKSIIAFANLALAAFVVASIAARFVLPSLSLEGKAFWIPYCASIAPREIWWSKFIVGLVPLLVVAEALVILTNYYLGVGSSLRWLSATTIACLTPAIVALALAVGCAAPRFDIADPVKVAAGLPGLVFMVLALLLVSTVVLLAAWPTYLLSTARLAERSLTPIEFAGVAVTLSAALSLTLAVPVLARRYAVARLEQLEL